MATIKDWKLGDVPHPGYRLVRELVALPTSRELILKALGDILAKNVQKVVVEIRKPIEVLRLAKESEAGPLVEDVTSDDLYAMVRNAAMEPVIFVPTAPVMHRLMDLMKRVTEAGLAPVSMLCGDADEVADWLDYPPQFLSHIMGIPLAVSTEVPPDVLIIACRLHGELEGVDQSFKITLDKPEVTP
jgi:hypothetical protein